jgi:hypothetical protein
MQVIFQCDSTQLLVLVVLGVLPVPRDATNHESRDLQFINSQNLPSVGTFHQSVDPVVNRQLLDSKLKNFDPASA